MPGRCTSIEKTALPLTLAGVSRRLSGLPISWKSLGSLSGTSAGAVQLRRRVRQLAVGRATARRVVDHEALLGAARGGGHAPGARGRLHQQRARRRAGLAHRQAHRERARAAAGHLDAEARVRVDRIDGRELEAHLRPVGVELVGQQHGTAKCSVPWPISDLLTITVTRPSVAMRTKALGAKLAVAQHAAAPLLRASGNRPAGRRRAPRRPAGTARRAMRRALIAHLPSGPRPRCGSRCVCARRSRSGRRCPTCRRRSPRRSASASPRAARPRS